jgi:DNA invertase Pin-like site-specific DNA recombinase
MATSYASRKGLELDTSLTFHDLGVSAFKGANAETGRLADFLEAVKTGMVPQGSFLLVEALDRLSRLAPRRALRVLEEIVDSGVTVVTLNDEKSYTTGSLDRDPIDLMVAIMLFMRANEESATKARRLAASWEGKRLTAGTKPLTSVVPAWIRLDKDMGPNGRLVLIPERATVVQRIFAEHLSGIGMHTITLGLIKDGVPCFGRATMWHRTYVSKILKNPSTYGLFIPHQNSHEGTKTIRTPLTPIEGYYPAVISQATFEASQRFGGTAHSVKNRAGQLVNLLGGLAVCPLCGATMTRVNKGAQGKAGKTKLVCVVAKAGAGCSYHGVDITTVEHGIVSNVGALVGNAPSGVAGLDGELEHIEDQIDVIQGQAINLTDALSQGSSPTLSKRLREMEITLSELEMSKADLLDKIATGSSPVLAQRLKALEVALTAEPLDRPLANVALRSVLTSVVVDFPNGILIFNWKHGGESSVTFAWQSAAAYAIAPQ